MQSFVFRFSLASIFYLAYCCSFRKGFPNFSLHASVNLSFKGLHNVISTWLSLFVFFPGGGTETQGNLRSWAGSCIYLGFPGGTSGKEPPCSAGDVRDTDRFDSWIGKGSWRRQWQPTPVSLPRESRTGEPGRLQFIGSQRAGH